MHHGWRRSTDETSHTDHPSSDATPAGKRRRVDAYAAQQEAQYVHSVQAATAVAFEETACRPPDQVYVALAWELASRGIDPEPSAVFDAAVLISRGRRPAVLSDRQDSDHRGQSLQ